MATLREKIATKAKSDDTLKAAQDKLMADLDLVATDRQTVDGAATAQATAAKDVADTIAKQNPETGEAVDPNPGTDGKFTVYKTDQSAQGYHTYSLPSIDAAIDEPAPDVTTEPPADTALTV